MRKLLGQSLFIVILVFASSCSSNQQLYYWGKVKNGTNMYNDVSYNYYKTQTPDDFCAMMTAYQIMVSEPGGTRQIPPPGICAEFGYFLLRPESREMFEENATRKQKKILTRTDFAEYGKELLEKEIEFYPESKKFLERIVNRLNNEEK